MRRPLVLFAVPILLALGACGSSKKESTPAATAVAGGAAATTATARSTVDTSAATVATEASGSAPAVAAPEDAEFCQLDAQFTKILADATDPVSRKAAYEQVQALLPQIVAVAPAAIKADTQTAASAFGDYRTALEAVGWDPTKLTDDTIVPPEVQAAGQRMDAYTRTHCPEG